MRIKNISLKNFKFHHELDFPIKKQNCLIYGENGSGKSSIFLALYSNLYSIKDKDIANNIMDIREEFRHRDYPAEALEVDLDFGSGKIIKRSDNTLDGRELLNEKAIYLADEKTLNKIISNNFYSIIENYLQNHFPQLKDIFIYSELERDIKRISSDEPIPEELYQKRLTLDFSFKEKFNEAFPLNKINSILSNNFKEKLIISFSIADSKIDERKLIYPKVSIKVEGIEDNGNLKNHINEGRLKLISISIYFALAKKYEYPSASKLLILDDFLTSLDMANRKLIVQFVLDEFEEYQIIILTHNIQFYNLIVKLLNMRTENNKWDMKKIFSRINNDKEESLIYDINENFLSLAIDNYDKNDLSVCGNYLRKEFERIISEFKDFLAIGKAENLNNILNSITSDNIPFVENPFKVIADLKAELSNFNRIFSNQGQPDNAKNRQLEIKINRLNKLLTDNECDLSDAKVLLKKTKFYQGVLMHPSSHNDLETEIYRKECLNSIDLLKKLNKNIKELKGS